MDTIIGDYYQEDLQLKNSAKINFQFNTRGFLIYEVFRVTGGVLLFLDDHLERLHRSLLGLGIAKKCNASELINSLKSLVLINENRTGNIKLLCKLQDGELHMVAYYFPHEYPTFEMYRSGIKLVTYAIERPDPNVKQVFISESIRREIENTRIKTLAYEVLLINSKGYITEGSKSNIFFINEGQLFSPPEKVILNGITRRHIVNIARKKNIPMLVRAIGYTEIGNYESAFICGTSPKILPVNSIDDIPLKVNNEITGIIMNEYDLEIQNYIKNNLVNKPES